MTMGDQVFTCGRYKNRTFDEVARTEPEFCKSVLDSPVCNKYYPEDFKSYLLSLGPPPISESNVKDFIKKLYPSMRTELQQIIGSPTVETKQVHPKSSNHPHGNLGVFIRYFIKKCIFNVQNADASSHCIQTFASIFPFRVSKTVPSAKLPVRELFDEEFNLTIAAFMVRHFEGKCDLAVELVDLFLRNIYHFKEKHFNEGAIRTLKSIVDSAVDTEKRAFRPFNSIDYLKQFPRLNKAGVTRYMSLRWIYNSLCATFGRQGLGEQNGKQVEKLPEFNCYELLQLLESDFYLKERAKYIEWFQKYLFFFANAVDNENHPIFFIDDTLYECLKGYTEYQSSRENAEKLQLCIWMVTLIHRRTQPLDLKNNDVNFKVDEKNLEHIRQYVENFPGIETAVVDYALPTSLLYLGIPIVTKDTVFTVTCKKADTPTKSYFDEGIIRALMCDRNVEKVVIYNSHSGVEESLTVPAVKKEVLEFIRRYNKYDPTQQVPVENTFTDRLENFFEKSTIQWDEKCTRKSNPHPVHEYKDILCQ